MSEKIIEFENVTFVYDRMILSEVNFSFFAGGFYFLTGESGIGKTTLLKLIYRDLIPTHGSVRVFSKDLNLLSKTQLPFFRRKIGLVFQDCRLCEKLTVFENVILPMKIMGAFNKKILLQTKDLLEWVGLKSFFDSYPTELSDGQKQRVSIARAVLMKPALFLADEPTGNVDDQTAKRLIILFQELNKAGTTIIIATHNYSLIHDHQAVHLQSGQLYQY